MKKNIFVFVISSFIVLCGMVCTPFWTGVKYNTVMFVKNCLSTGFFTALQTYADSMEKATTDNLSYHSTFMDINSVYMSAVNTRIVEKPDSIVIKAQNGYLLNLKYYVDDVSLENRVQKVNEVYSCAKENGAEFLYVMAPSKGYSTACPENVSDFTRDNCDRFSAFMEDAGVPYLNLIDSMNRQGITEEEMFFATDHHWRPHYGMWASEQICSRLSSDYGFEYDKKYINSPLGKLIITNNSVLRNDPYYNEHYDTQYSYYIIDKNGDLSVGSNSSSPEYFNNIIKMAKHTFAFGIPYRINGTSQATWGGVGARRQMLCQINHNNYAIVTTEMNATFSFVGAIANALGCYTAVNLDGGGSTSLVIKQAGEPLPGDVIIGGTRRVGDMIYFSEL